MSDAQLEIEVRQEGPVCYIALNRPSLHNAFNADLLQQLTSALRSAQDHESVRVVVLEGRGRSFCAGADLDWMRAMVEYTPEENVRDSMAMAEMYRTLHGCTKPVVGRIHGAAIGGGVGLVACVDIAIASERARFGLSEVRLGLAPAVISPYVIERIGVGAARRYFLTGERFDSAVAKELGLVSEVVAEAEIDEAVQRIVQELLRGAPVAQSACKQLIQDVPNLEEGAVDAHTSKVIAGLRTGEEGQEGMHAFLEKRKAAWIQEEENE